jgi:uracil-DNA glycosylase family protein
MARAQPPSPLARLAAEAEGCRRCDLWANATQVVFGEGPVDAPLVLVGEQPGDVEDRQGAPFVGPAGHLLDEAVAAVGLDRNRIYVTNAVKHFKWQPRGKRRIHQKPNRTEVVACHHWLAEELECLRGDAVVVAMGATAGQALLGPSFRVGTARGQVLELDGRPLVATIHPSAILRAKGDDREAMRAGFVEDLRRAADLAAA